MLFIASVVSILILAVMSWLLARVFRKDGIIKEKGLFIFLNVAIVPFVWLLTILIFPMLGEVVFALVVLFVILLTSALFIGAWNAREK
jgi:hypothetical protein